MSRFARSRSRVTLALGAATLLLEPLACGDASSPDGSSGRDAPARLTVPIDLSGVARAGAAITLQLTASTRRADGAAVELARTLVVLSDAAAQQVPLAVPLAACLTDASVSSCDVSLDATLSKGGRVVDAQSIAPMRLLPGGAVTASGAVRFAEIASVRVAAHGSDAPAAGQALRVQLGATVTLDAALLAADGVAVSGRTVRWRSDTPTIAGVDSTTGVVTASALGTTRVTAVTAMGTGAVDVAVVPRPSPITVTGSGTGIGTVRSTPNGIVCSIVVGQAQGSCAAPFAVDARVTLTATPEDRTAFTGWGGACAAAGVQPTCVVDAAQAREVVAGFALLRELIVSGALNGRGTIVSTPAGISCRAAATTSTGACRTSVVDGTTITLTATPDRQHRFTGWGGACATTVGATCALRMTSDTVVDARFTAPPSLSIAVAGTGNGRIMITADDGSEAPFVCAPTAPSSWGGSVSTACTTTYAVGTAVTLTATPDSVSELTSWSGACAGTGSCRLTVDVSKTVIATFGYKPTEFAGPLRLEVSGGIGTLSVDGVVACARTALSPYTVRCTYPHHAAPDLVPTVFSAQPLIGRIVYWTGLCGSVLGSECRVMAPGDATIGVVFYDPPGAKAETPPSSP